MSIRFRWLISIDAHGCTPILEDIYWCSFRRCCYLVISRIITVISQMLSGISSILTYVSSDAHDSHSFQLIGFHWFHDFDFYLHPFMYSYVQILFSACPTDVHRCAKTLHGVVLFPWTSLSSSIFAWVVMNAHKFQYLFIWGEFHWLANKLHRSA